jgi:two-component system chemotaxis response regulator CheY
MNRLLDLKILIVDDEPFVRSTIKAVLRVIDRFVIAEAGGGEAALSLVADTTPDVVLCDINMAPMSGLQFVERLRNHDNPALRGIPVVLVTGHTDEQSVQDALRLRIAGYLVKPISPKQIGDRLHAIFRERQPGSGVAALERRR